MRRRLSAVIIAVLLVMTGTPVMDISASALQDDIEVHYSVTASDIRRGDSFTMTITLENISDVGDDDFDNIDFDINTNSNFTVLGGQSSIDDAKFGIGYAINLRYEGGSNNVPILISYKKGTKAFSATYTNITIGEIDTDSSSSGVSGNEPKLVIVGTSIPEASAGEVMKVSLTVSNESKYGARNITVKLIPEDSDSSPFEMDSLSLTRSISTLSPGRSEGVVFDLKVKPYAEAKTYTMNVEFKYDNSRNNSFSSTEKIYVKVTGKKNEPVLMLGEIKYSANPVKAGAKFQVGIDISNAGDLDAEGVRLSVEGLKKEEFTLSWGSDSWYFDRIKGKDKKNIVLSLTASDSMGSGNYGLDIKMDYKDQRNTSYSNTSTFFINVQGGNKSSNVAVGNITVMPGEVKTNENFMISFDVHNQGKTDAKNIKVTVKGDEGIISRSPDVTMIEELAAGGQQRLEYMLYADGEAKTKNYNILINIEYEDQEKADSKHSVNQYAGVYVKGGNSKITPKIIISNYKFEPKLVRAGDEFSLDLTFMNASNTKEVKNVKIYLTGIDSDKEGNVVFTPVGSSNTFFVDSIEPKGTAARGITMYTIPDAQPKYYNITANIEYQDEDGTEYKAAELIGIPVIQQSRLDASEISLPPEVYIGQPMPVSLQYYNKGKTKLSNLMIKIEGDFQVENGEAFIGNFESGSSDYYEAMLTAMKPGPAAGKVVFSYEDPSGEEFTYEREFTINAVEMPPMDIPGEMPPAPVSTKDKIINSTIKNKYFWIGAVVVAAAVFTSRRLIRRRKRKGMELDE